MASKIIRIDKKSPLRWRAHVGDELVAIDGHPIGDVLDYEYWSYGARLSVTLRGAKGERTLRVRKREGTALGLDFEDYLMDKPRHCANRCIFCFVDQLPKGLRAPLYFKDDDARLSFLTGSYITLTNLSERELERILQLRISPVNVSVHATEPALRAHMLGTPRAAGGYALMERLAAGGIEMNCQVVVCPGVNDGEHLQRTMDDLSRLYPHVPSVSIVPVGLTMYREGLAKLTPYTAETAGQTIDLVNAYNEKCLEKYGSRIFFCADELFLKAKRELPPEDYYEGYPQIENGVGLMRSMEEEFMVCLGRPVRDDFCVATGVASAPYIRKLLAAAGSDAPVYAIVNDFFGHTIDVAGLVTGRDLIAQLKDRPLRPRLLIPNVMLRHGGDVFLDDVTPAQVEQALGVKLVDVKNDGRLFFECIANG